MFPRSFGLLAAVLLGVILASTLAANAPGDMQSVKPLAAMTIVAVPHLETRAAADPPAPIPTPAPGPAPTPTPPPVPKAVISSNCQPVGPTLNLAVGKRVRLGADGAAYDTISWVIDPDDSSVLFNSETDLAGVPGATPILIISPTDAAPIYVTQIAVLGGKVAKSKVVVNPQQPGPGPSPGPGPNPSPSPSNKVAAGNLWILEVVPDLTQATADQNYIAQDSSLLNELDKKGNHFRYVDQKVASTIIQPWVALAASAGLPRLLVVAGPTNGVGKLIESVPLTNAADALKLVQKWEAP
jgi:hypothetical protein